MRLFIPSIELLQHTKDKVLSSDLESVMNRKLNEKHPKWQIRVDKTYFCKVFEKELLKFSALTPHQQEKLNSIEKLLRQNKAVHLSAPAGAGKSFIAVQCTYNMIKSHSEGQVLFAAPSLSLGLYFAQWLGQTCADNLSLERLLTRVVFMQQPHGGFLSLHVEGGRLKWSDESGFQSKKQFIFAVIDEAHDFFGATDYKEFIKKTIHAERHLLLTSKSQASAQFSFSETQEIKLTQVVRSTKRVVAGAAAFQGSAEEKHGVSSLCPSGPPLKSYLFDSDETEDMDKYAEKAFFAICELIRIYGGLNFHRRVALLVENEDFLKRFQKKIAPYLQSRFAKRKFEFTRFQDSLSILPHLEGQQTSEVLVLDTVANAKGLEQLIVLCIGLDEKIGDPKANLATRAVIYQAITRAQLQAVVVNQRLEGGWLEYLGLLKFKEAEFSASSAMAETTTEAAAQIISQQAVAGEASPAKGSKDQAKQLAKQLDTEDCRLLLLVQGFKVLTVGSISMKHW
eukprot:Skav200596  [mRNA]  locus=scaffold1278:77944:79473:- [translate_table: standard]